MNAQPDKQVVVFQVGNDKFALDILSIREIARHQSVRKIPRAPDFLSGVIDLRGSEIVPIIDLHDRLDLEPIVPLEKSRIIIAPVDRQIVGFRVDIVRDVMTVPAAALEAPPAVGAAPDFLEAVVRTKDEIILLLNIRNVLTSEEKLKMVELRSRLSQPESASAAAATPGPGAETPNRDNPAQPAKPARPRGRTKKS